MPFNVLLDTDPGGAVVFDEYGVTDADRTAQVAVDVDIDGYRTLLGERLSRLS